MVLIHPVFLRRWALGLALAGNAALARAQSVGIGTTAPNAAAALDITATGKGLLIPRLDSVARVAIANPPTGLMVFQTGPRAGFYYCAGGSWLFLPDKSRAGDDLGSHTATRNLNLGAFQLVGNGGSQGLSIDSNGQVGIGTGSTAPRGTLDVAGRGNSYFVNNPDRGLQDQTVFLPGHLFLAPYTGTSGTAYVQARVPTPTTRTNIGLMLRTTSAGALVDALTLNAKGDMTTAGSLSTGGSVSATGSLSTGGSVTVPPTSAYQYAAPKTYYATFGAADLFSDYNQFTVLNQLTTDEVYCSGGFYSVLRAPLHLPQGAVITGIRVNYYDMDSNYDMTFSVCRLAVTGITTALATVSSITPGGTPGYGLAVGGVNEVVDNASYHYFVKMEIPGSNYDLRISAVRITYTLTQVE